MAKKLTAWQKVKQIFWRMIATFAANGLATIGAGSLIGIEILDAIILAGTLGVVKVAESMDVTPNSINRTFIKALTSVMAKNKSFDIDEFLHKCDMKRMKIYRSKQDNIEMIVEIYNWRKI